jgi:hypothetical protein
MSEVEPQSETNSPEAQRDQFGGRRGSHRVSVESKDCIRAIVRQGNRTSPDADTPRGLHGWQCDALAARLPTPHRSNNLTGGSLHASDVLPRGDSLLMPSNNLQHLWMI